MILAQNWPYTAKSTAPLSLKFRILFLGVNGGILSRSKYERLVLILVSVNVDLEIKTGFALTKQLIRAKILHSRLKSLKILKANRLR